MASEAQDTGHPGTVTLEDVDTQGKPCTLPGSLPWGGVQSRQGRGTEAVPGEALGGGPGGPGGWKSVRGDALRDSLGGLKNAVGGWPACARGGREHGFTGPEPPTHGCSRQPDRRLSAHRVEGAVPGRACLCGGQEPGEAPGTATAPQDKAQVGCRAGEAPSRGEPTAPGF